MISDHVVHPSRLDAGVRLIAIFVPAGLIGLTLNPAVLQLLTITAFTLVILAGVRVSDLAKAAVPLLMFCAITLTMHLLFSQSHDAISVAVGPLNLNKAALITGLLYCWRIALFFLVAICFVRWIGQEEFAESIWRALTPLGRLGIPAQGIGMAVTIAIRFIPQIFAEHRRIEMAQRARGAQISKTWFKGVRRFVPLLVPTIASALRRIDITADALTVRAWGVYPTRTFHRCRKLGAGDLAVLLATLLIIIAAWVLTR